MYTDTNLFFIAKRTSTPEEGFRRARDILSNLSDYLDNHGLYSGSFQRLSVSSRRSDHLLEVSFSTRDSRFRDLMKKDLTEIMVNLGYTPTRKTSDFCYRKNCF